VTALEQASRVRVVVETYGTDIFVFFNSLALGFNSDCSVLDILFLSGVLFCDFLLVLNCLREWTAVVDCLGVISFPVFFITAVLDYFLLFQFGLSFGRSVKRVRE
jgi:hypothetical protein